jgi:ribosomal-protein-alanine N-acetyltransferase
MSLQLDFTPFPVLETPRLILREPVLSDSADIFEMRSDPEVMKYIPRPLATSLTDVEVLLDQIAGFVARNERINWAIEWKETGKVVGLIGYVNINCDHSRAEVGYALNRQWHRMGIMREALMRVLEFGFDTLQCHTIMAITDAQNDASGCLLKEVGFVQEGHFREDFQFNGVFRDSNYYGMLKTEFVSSAKPGSERRIVKSEK